MSAGEQSPAGNQAAANLKFEWDVLISYGRDDSAELARRIVSALKKKDIKVWIDEEQLDPGDTPALDIPEAMAKSRAVAFIISPASLDSGWVEKETGYAISSSANRDWHGRIIPILAGVNKPPGFLSSYLWVDFTDDTHFEENIKRLIKGIQEGEPAPVRPPRNEDERKMLSRLRFLWFFPEGMLVKLYDHLVSKTGSMTEAAQAEQRGLVRYVKTTGPELKGAVPERVSELGGCIDDITKDANEFLRAVNEWIEASFPFDFIGDTGIGVGRALLVRDILSLARHLPDDEDAAIEERKKACLKAREYLPFIINEGLLRIGLEVSGLLLSVSNIQLVTDNLMHARVLLRVGHPSQAVDIFDTYRGDNLFDDIGLDRKGRLACALDWAKALKEAQLAREKHQEIVKAYGQMLDLVHEMKAENGDADYLLRQEAKVRNNRATQIAQFGREEDWPEAREDFDYASSAYGLLGDGEKLMAVSANAVSHALDHFDRTGKKATEEELKALLKSLEDLNNLADGGKPGYDLFFFLYQKARLLKRLYTEEPRRALEVYKWAVSVAEVANLPHCQAIAHRWMLRLLDKAGDIAEDDYLAGLHSCVVLFGENPDDAWSSNALFDTLLDLTHVLRRRYNKEEAWRVALKAFDLAARRQGWKMYESGPARLKNVVRLLSELQVRDELRAAFITKNAPLLRALLNIPTYQSVSWEQVAERLGKQKGDNGNSIH